MSAASLANVDFYTVAFNDRMVSPCRPWEILIDNGLCEQLDGENVYIQDNGTFNCPYEDTCQYPP